MNLGISGCLLTILLWTRDERDETPQFFAPFLLLLYVRREGFEPVCACTKDEAVFGFSYVQTHITFLISPIIPFHSV